MFTTRSGTEPRTAAVSDITLRILVSARPYLARHGRTLADAVEAICDPDDSWVAPDGSASIYVRDGIAYVIGNRDDTILSVTPERRARRHRSVEHPLDATDRRRTHGTGRGSSRPTDTKALIVRLRELGVDVRRTRGGHWRASNRHGYSVFAATPSDSRSLRNSMRHIEHHLRIDLRRSS